MGRSHRGSGLLRAHRVRGDRAARKPETGRDRRCGRHPSRDAPGDPVRPARHPVMTGSPTSDTAISNATFYGMLGDTERRWLNDRGTVHVWRQGYIMTVEGQPVENVMVIMHGLAAASCGTEGRTEMLLRLYRPGDVIGGDAVL